MPSDQNNTCENSFHGEPPLRYSRFPSPRRRFNSLSIEPSRSLDAAYDGEDADAFQRLADHEREETRD